MSDQNHCVIPGTGPKNRYLSLLVVTLVIVLPLQAQVPGAPRPPREARVDTAIQLSPAPEIYVFPDLEDEIMLPELEYIEELLEQQELQREFLEERRFEDAVKLQEEAARAQREAVRAYRMSTRLAETPETLEAYQDAYGLILDQRWKEARNAYEEFLEKYSESRYVDDARFWICYSMEQAGLSPEEVFRAYHKFIQEFANSKWLDDARANLIRIGRDLAAKSRKAKAEYGPIIEQLEEEYNIEVTIATLDRLSYHSSKNTLKAVFGLYDRTKNDELRKKIVYALRRFDDKAVLDKLGNIARNDPNPDIRQAAVEAIGRRGGKEAFEILKSIIEGEGTTEVRQQAIRSLVRRHLRRSESKEAVSLLLELARNDPHVKVRTEAVSALSRITTSDAQEALIMLLEGK
ncbi:MAG: HEAT repeat domain-containing protein [Fidelibacterota bacterium]|nr:MAG: HEAT repeat domain-containing protein [Candidatus Neomarinimicrobiota bacterium]